MTRWIFVLACACGSDAPREAAVDPKPPEATARKPPDQMDEKMRHCPLALDGAVSTLEDIEGGVRFTIKVANVAEVRKRAQHVVEFAAKRSRAGHGEFDGKGGGRMKNCPVVTDGVTITATDIDGGTTLELVSTKVDDLRREARRRADAFSFTGATIVKR